MENPFLKSRLLERVIGIFHVFSTREGGKSCGPFESLNFGTKVGDDPSAIENNLDILADHLRVLRNDIFWARQVHGNNVVILDDLKNNCDVYATEADSLVTAKRGVMIGVKTADCVPILICDENAGIVGAVHSGWRGTLSSILSKTLEKMRQGRFAGARLKIAIGPSIGPCCYKIGADLKSEFLLKMPYSGKFFIENSEGIHLDLRGLNREIALRSGILECDIDVIGICTACRKDIFFSYRRDGEICGRHYSGIMIR